MEEELYCFYCSGRLCYESPNGRDTETMGGVPVEYLVCENCKIKYSDTRYLDDPPNLCVENGE